MAPSNKSEIASTTAAFFNPADVALTNDFSVLHDLPSVFFWFLVLTVSCWREPKAATREMSHPWIFSFCP